MAAVTSEVADAVEAHDLSDRIIDQGVDLRTFSEFTLP